MSTEAVSWLELLHRYCRQHGLALLLVAEHSPGTFAKPARTRLQYLDVLEIADGPRGMRGIRLRAGDLAIRADLDMVDGDLEAAAELLVGLLTRSKRQAA